MLYYADRISDNISKREPEGYLICVNVPIARSGPQEYLKEEVEIEGDGLVTVYRPEEEVFSEATIASFEGMPVTNDHPDTEGGVTAENFHLLNKGHCQNVHRGTGSEKNMLIGDLVINDPATIQDVLNGKREISCGYNYELCEEDGKFIQRRIRGNHIAIVDKGRAGKRVSIKDSAPINERRKKKMANTKNGILARMFAAFAKDADPEEIEQAVDAITDITSETPAAEPVQPAPETTDEAPDKLDEVLDLLKQLLAQKGADCGTKDEEPAPEEVPEEPADDPLQKLEDDLKELEAMDIEEEAETPEEDPSEPESRFVEPEEINEQDEDETAEEEEEEKPAMGDKSACDAARLALKAIRPVIAKLPPSERKEAADAAVKMIRESAGMDKKPASNGYIALKSRKKASDSKPAEDLGKRIMASRNINYNK